METPRMRRNIFSRRGITRTEFATLIIMLGESIHTQMKLTTKGHRQEIVNEIDAIRTDALLANLQAR